MLLTIPILSALLLSLISGSTEGGQRMDSVALLRQTLRYWRKIYKTYHEEVMLGYCWADYLLEISDELSANLSATSRPFLATGDHSSTSIEATKSQQKPFPQNVMVHVTPNQGTRTGKHLRAKRSHATASSTIWKFINGPDERGGTSRSRIIGKRQRWTRNTAERDVALTDRADESDGNESTMPLIDSYDEKRRHAPTTTTSQDVCEGEASPHEFSSRRTSSRAVNPPTSNPPKDDDKVDSRSANSEGEENEGDARRKVLRSLTNNRDSSAEIESVLQPRTFSLKVSRGRERRSLDCRRFPFRRWPQLRERAPRIVEPLSDPCRMLEVDRRTRRDPRGCRVPLSDDGMLPSSWRLQFRRINADTNRRRPRAVKLMDFEGNSSRDPAGAINSRTWRRMLEELSRDSLLSPRVGGIADTERSTHESRRGGRVAIKRNAFPGAEMTGVSARRERCSRSRKRRGSRTGKDISLVVMCIFCGLGLERTNEFQRTRPESIQRREQLIRATRSASLLPLEEFIDNRGNSTKRSVRNSIVRRTSVASTIRSIVIAVLRTLGMFVQVGRQIIDVVESNTALVCAKEYLWLKIIKWIDA